MGRQLPVRMSEEKEYAFGNFLKSKGDILIFNMDNTEPSLNVIDLWTPEKGYWKPVYTDENGTRSLRKKILIWNKQFKFPQAFDKVGTSAVEQGLITEDEWEKKLRTYCLHQFWVGPFIEYDRGGLVDGLFSTDPKVEVSGRIYWSRGMAENYDVKEFAKWYSSVANWIKRNCKQDADTGIYRG